MILLFGRQSLAPTSDIDNGLFYVNDSKEGKVEYYCNGHKLTVKGGVEQSDLTLFC